MGALIRVPHICHTDSRSRRSPASGAEVRCPIDRFAGRDTPKSLRVLLADLRFGTFLAPNMLRVYQAIADAVGDRLGTTTELIVETDHENCRNDVNDLRLVCSLMAS